MIGIKFPSTDKGRWCTEALDIGSKKTFSSTKEIIEFFKEGYNTFFITDKEEFPGKIRKFKQGKDKDRYITQGDLADEKASVIGLDLDRHKLIDGAATNTDKVQGLTDLSKEFGTVLYAPSKSSTDEIFSGRIFIFLNKRVSKQVFRKYLELWAHERYGSAYLINHHRANAYYFLTGEQKEGTHISHEYIDRVAFNPSHKLNVYDDAVFELYHEGKKIWQTEDEEVPDIALTPRNVANRLQRFGKAEEIGLYNTYNDDNALPICDILHPDEKERIIKEESLTARERLATIGTPVKREVPDKEALALYQREFKEGEYPADGKLRRASDGEVKSASEWVADKSVTGNFAYEPNIRKETGYLYLKNGKIFDYQGGMTTLVVLKRKSIFAPVLSEIEGDYLPNDYYAYVMGKERLAFCQAPTGSGKSHGCASLKNTIFLVPTRALGSDLDKKEGFIYVHSSGDDKGDLKRFEDIPSQRAGDTIVMTYDKFAYIYDTLQLRDYNIIVDEAHLLFSQHYDKFTQAREQLMWAMFNKMFKSVMLMSANPNFYEAYEPFLVGESPRVVVYTKPKTIDFIIKPDFSTEEMVRFGQERTIVYCNDKGLAEVWAQMIGGSVISSENRIMSEIDDSPTKNFVFTAVMREGYSFRSNVDNFIIDTRVNVITGANSVVQAASRARCGAERYYIRHGMGKVKGLVYRLGCISVPLYSELASIFYDKKTAYTKEERDVIKHLPLYAPVAKAVSGESEKVFLSNLVALSLEAHENLERMDIALMIERLENMGYRSRIEEIDGEIARLVKVRKEKSEDERKILKKGKEAYRRFDGISGKFLKGNELKNKVLGLYNSALGKRERGMDVKTAVAFLRKVDVAVVPINTEKLNMGEDEFRDATKDFTKDEMERFMRESNIKRGRGAHVMYWVENIFKLFEEEEKRSRIVQRLPIPPSFPPPSSMERVNNDYCPRSTACLTPPPPPPLPPSFGHGT